MKCDKVRARLVAYLNQALNQRLQNKIAMHLATCTQCQRELTEIKLLYDSLSQYQPTTNLPISEQEFLMAVKTRIHQENLQTRPVRWRARLAPILASALSLIIIVVGLLYLTHRRQNLQLPEESAQFVLVGTEEISPEFIYKHTDITIQEQVLDNFLDDVSLEDLQALETEIISDVESDNLLDILSDEEKDILYTNLLEIYYHQLNNNDNQYQNIGG
ncbi:MAG: zf-HC2 domain-containing protein [candidate division WOR-3 bacterium]